MSTIISEDICIRQGAEYRRELKRIRARYMFKALTAGTSDASAPTWPTLEDETVADNTITWANEGLWNDKANPSVDVWLPSTVYGKRSRVVTPIESVDLTGYTGAFQIRATVDAADPPIHSGVVSFGTRADGEFAMIIPTVDTGAFTFGSAVYDLELITAGAEVDFVLRGNVTYLIEEVTR